PHPHPTPLPLHDALPISLNIPIVLQDVVLSRLDETLAELMRSPRFARRNGAGKRHVKKPAAGVVSFARRRASVVSPRSKATVPRSEEHTSELQSRFDLVW